ncbi:6074_t:CDS:2 [Ambispora leptoticha]|uniref:6074_t:CDS:1 n=1 Tax=Ambispora leptoticha TaxID=144679 RepID=A0A9N9DTK4_9GLOM|nr:6074_t:CDS:2 [Ambispora leptoticha]
MTPTATTQIQGTVIGVTVNPSQPAISPSPTQNINNVPSNSSNAERNNSFTFLSNVVIGLTMIVGMNFWNIL